MHARDAGHLSPAMWRGRPLLNRNPPVVGAGISAAAAALLHGVSLLPVPRAHAANYPEKPIRLIVPFGAGGSADNLARTMQAAWSKALGTPLVIDNRAGASSIIGTDIAAHAPADGYTVLLTTTTHSTNPSLILKLPYDAVKDFAMVSLLVSQPNLLCVHPSLAAKTVNELVNLAKAKPNTLNFASGGSGSSPHLSGELFKIITSTQITHIPYKGTGPAAIDLASGQAQMMFAGPLVLESYVRSGRVRALAVADLHRLPALPEVQTMAESGIAGVESGTWYGVLAPAAVPRSVVAILNRTLVQVIRSPDVEARLIKQGVGIIASSPEEFHRYMIAEIAKWAKVIKQSNIRPD